ncbi:hypothetical protein BJV78DRAFT_1355878 [Lactifluus subvellereus]|nr:hypothetical protein BJV78DRAFT_1355878 [Lactifluus subvellereus]
MTAIIVDAPQKRSTVHDRYLDDHLGSALGTAPPHLRLASAHQAAPATVGKWETTTMARNLCMAFWPARSTPTLATWAGPAIMNDAPFLKAVGFPHGPLVMMRRAQWQSCPSTSGSDDSKLVAVRCRKRDVGQTTEVLGSDFRMYGIARWCPSNVDLSARTEVMTEVDFVAPVTCQRFGYGDSTRDGTQGWWRAYTPAISTQADMVMIPEVLQDGHVRQDEKGKLDGIPREDRRLAWAFLHLPSALHGVMVWRQTLDFRIFFFVIDAAWDLLVILCAKFRHHSDRRDPDEAQGYLDMYSFEGLTEVREVRSFLSDSPDRAFPLGSVTPDITTTETVFTLRIKASNRDDLHIPTHALQMLGHHHPHGARPPQAAQPRVAHRRTDTMPVPDGLDFWRVMVLCEVVGQQQCSAPPFTQLSGERTGLGWTSSYAVGTLIRLGDVPGKSFRWFDLFVGKGDADLVVETKNQGCQTEIFQPERMADTVYNVFLT